MLKRSGNSILDADGLQLAVVVPSNCSRRDAQRWAQYIVDRVNADERGKAAARLSQERPCNGAGDAPGAK